MRAGDGILSENNLNWIANFIWGIADDVLRDVYVITKADLLIKGEDASAENMAYGSSLSADNFPAHEFDFMLSNPP